MAVDTKHQEKPWQNGLLGSKNKLNALFNEGHISDLTITFPGQEVKYIAHKVILGMSSTVFEQMLFGPMALQGSELELPDDDHEAFKIVLAHCYEVELEPSDIDTALGAYLLADKYFLDELKELCLNYIRSMINSDNIEKVLEFSSNFNFGSMRKSLFKPVKDSGQSSVFFSQEYLPEYLESNEKLEELVILDSWRNPNKILDEDSMLQLVKSKNCTNPGLNIFSGCVSAEVVKNICWNKRQNVNNLLNLSFMNYEQAKEIFRLLGDIEYRANFCTCRLSFHFQCNVIPVHRLGFIPALKNDPNIYISNVSDDDIDWVISALFSLNPKYNSFGVICFPRSELTLSGLKMIIRKTANMLGDDDYPETYVSSSNIPLDKQEELNTWIHKQTKNEFSYINLFEEDEIIECW